jgi:hypothetical protein
MKHIFRAVRWSCFEVADPACFEVAIPGPPVEDLRRRARDRWPNGIMSA